MTSPAVATLARPESETGHLVRRQAIALLLLVGLAYLLTQVVLFDEARFLGWDEAVYLSEASPDHHPIGFWAHRARGVVWLVTPVAGLGGSVEAVRWYLASIFSAGLALSFGAWVPLLGRGAALAAALFGFSWMGLFYGSEISPNLPAALLAVALAGVVAREVAGSATTKSRVAAGLLVALLTIMRPIDAVWIGFALGAVALAVLRRRSSPMLGSLGAGLVAGLIPWLIEAWIRFGGPLERLRSASRLTGAVPAGTIGQQLALLDGPFNGVDTEPLSAPGIAWAAGLLLFAATGVVVHRRGARARGALVAGFAAAAALAAYATSSGVLAPRFVLPALALAGVASAVGLLAVVRLLPFRVWRVPVAAVAALGMLGGWAMWQADLANWIEDRRTQAGELTLQLGEALRRESGGRPCRFESRSSFPQIAYASRCDGRALAADAGYIAALAEEMRRGDGILLLTPKPLDVIERQGAWRKTTVPLRGGGRWYLYVPVAGTGLTPAGSGEEIP